MGAHPEVPWLGKRTLKNTERIKLCREMLPDVLHPLPMLNRHL